MGRVGEGARITPAFSHVPQSTIIYIVIGILALLFFMQQFGTASIGKMFGPIMFMWFTMLLVLGLVHVFDDLEIFKALNPYYAVYFLKNYDGGF